MRRRERKVGKKYEFERYIEYEIKNLDDFHILENKVLIQYNEEEYNKTEGGIITIRDQDFAGHAIRRGKVIKLPNKLTCVRGNGLSMSWECDIDIKVGDIVYMTPQDSYHCYPFRHEDKIMKLVNYEGIILAKRKDDIIMCNGYVLLEKEMHTISFGKFEKEEERKNYGTVKAIGKPNRRRKEFNNKLKKDILVDDSQMNLKVGDKVYIHDPTRVFELEDFSHAKFDNRKIYNVCSRRRISAILEKID